jgi:hopanoid biosynthesis associated RND transporter like protein HpnN
MQANGVSERCFGILARLVLRRPGPVLLVCALLTGLALYASAGMHINTSTEGIFSPEARFIRNARAYEAIFPRKGEPIVAVIGAPSAERAQAAAEALVARLRADRRFRHVEVPGLEPYFRTAGLLFLDARQLRDLRAQLRRATPALLALADQPDLFGISKLIDLITAGVKLNVDPPPQLLRLMDELARTTRLQAAGEPAQVSWSSLFGLSAFEERGRQQIVLAYPMSDNTTVKRLEPALAAARAAAQEVSSREGVRIRFTGQPVLDQQELDAAFSGALYASLLSFALVLLTLVIGIRSGRLILMLTVALVVGSLWTSGLAAITVEQLNLISLAFGVLFFAIGVDFGTHLGLRYMEQAVGGSPAQAIMRAVVGEGPAITLSVICASVGFLSFWPTHYLGLAQLGIISALGMVAAFAVTLILLPAMLAAWPPARVTSRQTISRFPRWLRRRAVPVVMLAALATVAAALLGMHARVDVNPLNLQDPDTEPVRVYRELARDPITSPYGIDLLAPSLPAARGLADRLRHIDGVAQVRTVESFVPADQDDKRAVLESIKAQFEALRRGPTAEPGDAALRVALTSLRASVDALVAAAANLPTLRAAAEAFAAALDLFADKTGRDAPQLRSLNRALSSGIAPLLDQLRESAVSVALEDLPQALRREWLAPDGRVRVQVLPVAESIDGDRLEEFAARIQALAPDATGVPILIAGAAKVVRASFAQAVIITALAIIVILALVRRRISDVVLILTPLVLASIWTVAATVLLGLTFNFANVIVIPVLLGVGVASAIHVVSRAREMEGEGGFLASSTPRAVLLTDANTALAFAALAVSPHRGLFSLGLLLALATTLSLVASLIVLPAILTLLERRRRARPGDAAAGRAVAPARIAGPGEGRR